MDTHGRLLGRVVPIPCTQENAVRAGSAARGGGDIITEGTRHTRQVRDTLLVLLLSNQ